jgi:lipoyl(octanoyl) transferase
VNIKLNKETKFMSLGMLDYKEAWDYQEELFLKTIEIKTANRKLEEDQNKITPNYLIFLEHPHVYTLGKSGSEDNLLLDEAGLKDKKATYYKINRGGDITYHGPGQIVGYPILDLDNFFTDIHKYLRLLEEAVILTLKDYGIASGRIKGLTGVWIDFEEGARNPRKICALGVKSSRWVTMHGFAFNVNTDLNYFENIIPCGIDDKAVTSMAEELGKSQNMEEVSERLKNYIAVLFEMKFLEDK